MTSEQAHMIAAAEEYVANDRRYMMSEAFEAGYRECLRRSPAVREAKTYLQGAESALTLEYAKGLAQKALAALESAQEEFREAASKT